MKQKKNKKINKSLVIGKGRRNKRGIADDYT
jgi:hypothetical protein